MKRGRLRMEEDVKGEALWYRNTMMKGHQDEEELC